ncbi:MAG: EAL domain-containing protein [Pseudomonadota bacterium]
MIKELLKFFSSPLQNNQLCEKNLQQNELFLSSLFEAMPHPVFYKDRKGIYIGVNKAFEDFFGAKRDSFLYKSVFDIAPAHLAQVYFDKDNELFERGGIQRYESQVKNAKDEVRDVIFEKSLFYDKDNNILGLIGTILDISLQKKQQQQLEYIAHYDSLTSLPNRLLLSDRMNQAMAQVKRNNKTIAIVYLDLDGFKDINDNYGHNIGDQLLMVLASRMRRILRESDTIARLGGDEFVAILFDQTSCEQNSPSLDRLLVSLATPVYIQDKVLQVSASMGITFYPQHDDIDADQLIRQADQAMYQAKLAGKNRMHIFDTENDRNIRGHHESIEHIQQALIDNEFVLYYQPKVNMRTGQVVGVEALIRWLHPQQGLLPPIDFLPFIETHKLAITIGEWVIAQALNQHQIWLKTGLDISISINIGAIQLQHKDFINTLKNIIQQQGEVRAGALEIEILETSALEDITHISNVLKSCRKMGIEFALDDFGTGYSSLTYLRRLAVKYLKIDQSFVRNMLIDPEDLSILDGVLGLAGSFSRIAIAEGVETIEHGELLLQLGCELAQGYIIARPMLADEIPDWVGNWKSFPSWSTQTIVARDDLPLLYAGVEHKAWIKFIKNYLLGDKRDVSVFESQSCHFGQWLKQKGKAKYASSHVIYTIEELHDNIHILAQQLIDKSSNMDSLQIQKGLDELSQLQERLLQLLSKLL